MNKLAYLAYPLVAAFSLTAASAAFAAGEVMPDISPAHVFAPSKTRAQVHQELLTARADGSIKVWSSSYNALAHAKSLKTRAEVKAARDHNYASTYYGEDSGSFALSTQRPVRAVAPVYAAN